MKSLKIIISLLIALVWSAFYHNAIVPVIQKSDYVKYSGDSEAFLFAIILSAGYIIGLIPLYFSVIGKKKNLKVTKNEDMNDVKKTKIEYAKEIVSKHYNISVADMEKYSIQNAKEIISKHYNISLTDMERYFEGKKNISKTTLKPVKLEKEFKNYISNLKENIKEEYDRLETKFDYDKVKNIASTSLNIYTRTMPAEPETWTFHSDIIVNFKINEITFNSNTSKTKNVKFNDFEELKNIIENQTNLKEFLI